MALDSNYYSPRIFLLCNYVLLGAASSCIFLTLSLRLVPSLCGFLLILLHILTIVGAISASAAAASSSFTAGRMWYRAHMVATVLTAIFQGCVAVLIFTTTKEFLDRLNSYVREKDGAMILKLAGGLSALVFCLEWVVLTLAFFLNYYAFVESGNSSGNSVMVGGSKSKEKSYNQEEEMKGDLPFPLPV